MVAGASLPRSAVSMISDPPTSSETPPAGRLRRFFVRRLRFIAVAMPLACAVLLLPFDNFVMELLRHFRLWNAVIGLVTGVLLFLLRDWRFSIIALLAGLWQSWPVADYRLHNPGGINDGVSFTLLTCNLLRECREPDAMLTALREANADVLLLLEYTPEWRRKFTTCLWQDYPHRLEDDQPGYAGICLASKQPLESPEIIAVAGGSPVIRAKVGLITLLGVHPPPPMRPELYEVWRASFDEWPGLLKSATAAPSYVVLAGDLNCTPFARSFTALCERTGLRDSARGFALANTWHIADSPLGLPLDYVLVSSGLSAGEHTVGKAPGSDHRWVMVKLVPGH